MDNDKTTTSSHDTTEYRIVVAATIKHVCEQYAEYAECHEPDVHVLAFFKQQIEQLTKLL